jgi:predicted Zn-dependent peptidase
VTVPTTPEIGRIERTERTELGSGVRLEIAALPHVHRASVSVAVRSGPRFEPPELGGISHFLEHMLHRGIPSRPSAHEQALAFEELGTELSAATYADRTVLAASGPPETAEQVLELLGEVCRSPLFENIEVERGIVREEILELSNDDGELVDPDDLVVSLAFPGHGLGRPIIGSLAALERFDQPALRSVHAAHYVGAGLCVSVTGAVDPERIAAAAERAFGGFARGARLEDGAPPAIAGPVIGHAKDTTTQTALRLAFRAPGRRAALEPACELLLRLLDDGMSTRLYTRICDELGLAYDVSASYEAFDGAGLFTIASECAHARTSELLTQLLDVVTRLRDDGPTDAELERAKRRASWQMRALLDDPGELATFLGLAAECGRSNQLDARFRELASVGRTDVVEAARSVFAPQNLVLAAVGRQNPAQRRAVERVVQKFK